MDDITPGKDKVLGALDAAEQDGTLKNLDDLMKEYGWPLSAGTLLMLAQKDERTRGKTPDELTEMIRADTSLYDDLEAYQPGGKLEKLGQPENTEEEPAEPSEEESGGMGDYLGKSSGMKDMDPKMAFKSMKKAGAEKPADLEKDYDKKKAFMLG